MKGILERLEEIDVDNPDLSEEALSAALQAAGIDDEAEAAAAEEAKAAAAIKPIRLAIVGRRMPANPHSSTSCFSLSVC